MADILDFAIDDELDSEDEFSVDDIEIIEPTSTELIAGEMSREEAEDLTDAIRSTATATYVLLARAYENKAHKAMGYDTWADYVKAEFDISSSTSYQLLNLNRVVQAIESATPEGTQIRLTQAQAKDIKRELPRITERIQEETKELPPSEASERVDEIIAEEREKERQKELLEAEKAEEEAKKAREKEVEDAKEEGYQQGLEAAADALLEQHAEESTQESTDGDEGVDVELSKQESMSVYNFLNFATGLESMGKAEDFARIIPEERFGEFYDIAKKVHHWFSDLLDTLENKE